MKGTEREVLSFITGNFALGLFPFSRRKWMPRERNCLLRIRRGLILDDIPMVLGWGVENRDGSRRWDGYPGDLQCSDEVNEYFEKYLHELNEASERS